MLLGTCSCAVVRCVLCALSGFAAPGGRCCLAPVRVPWLWPAACLVAPRGAPRLVRSGRSRCSGRLSRRRGAFPHPGGMRPRLYWVAARGTRRPAENRAHCACRWPPPRQGRWARWARGPAMGLSLAGPSGAGLGLRALRWLMCVVPVTDASGFPYRPSFDGGLGRCTGAVCSCVDADTSPCGSEDATPGSRACVCVLVLPDRVGRAGLPCAFCCASPFPLAALSFRFAGPPPGWSCPFFVPLFARTSPLLLLFYWFFFCAPSVFCFSWCLAPGALGLGALRCLFCWPGASWLSVRSRFLCVAWRWAALLCPPPPPSLSCCCCRSLLPWGCFFLFPRLSPLVCAPLVSGFLCFPAPGALGLGAGLWLLCPAFRALCFFFLPPASWFFVRSRLFCVSRLAGGCSPVVVAPPFPPLLCLAAFVVPARCLGFFLSFSVRPCCLWLSLVCGPWCPGPWRCVLFVFPGLPLPGSPCALASFVLSAWPLAAPWWLPPPPPPCVSRFSSLPLGAVCRVLCVPGCVAAPRCCALCRPVLCCRVLCCFVALVWCRCLLRRALWRCPSAWGPVLCGAVLCGVPPRCVLCAACVLSWRGGACCCLPLCLVLCVSRGAVLCVPCPLRSVRCCASLCWCACVVLFVWCVPLLAPGAVVRCCVLCCFLWCAVVRCCVWWTVVVCWWRVSVSVSLSGRVVCFPVVGVVCCGALLPRVVFCGAVLSRGAVLLCSAVVLWCCWGLLCPPVACRAVLCCAVGWLCCFLPGGGVCVLWCSFPRAVRFLFSPLCALRCLVVLAVVPCFPVSCAVALCCRVVLCCRVLLSFCGAVCVCFALLWPVVRRRAVLCCAVGCLCRFLPGGSVCVLWCPFPPAATHKKHQFSYVSPCIGGGVVAGMPWWLLCPGLDAAQVPPAAKGRRKRRGWGEGGRGRYMANKREREGRVQGRGVLPKIFSVFYALLATQFSLRRRRIRRRQRRRCVPVSVTALTALFICLFRFKIFQVVF